MNEKMNYGDHNQAVNVAISVVKLDFLTWSSMGIDVFLEPALSGYLRNCSIFQPGRLLLDIGRETADF